MCPPQWCSKRGHDDPYRVIARLGQRVEGTLAPDAVLPTIVETVAQALKLPLELTEAGALCLDITDDGHGLSAHSTAGVGLTSIRERAAELGGACKITAEPTSGTRVWVRLPLAKE